MAGTEKSQEVQVFPPDPQFAGNAWIESIDEYERLYRRSVEDPEGYWAERAEDALVWTKKWDTVLEWSFDPDPFIKWFEGGELNASYNCIDRWVEAGLGDKPAIIFEGDPGDSKTYTYGQLLDEVSRFANVLKKHGVKKGDRVAIYMPMIAELAVVMLACARLGAIHMMVFGGFSSEALKVRIDNCGAKVLVCADKGHRGGKTTPSKTNADAAIAGETTVEKVIVVKRADGDVPMQEGRDVWYHEELAAPDISADCPPVPVDAEDPLFILYTSGSTGTPKGVLHTTGGYLLFVHDTTRDVFNLHDDDIHFCTADIGWITGHSYIVYGPLSLGATSILYEGLPTYPEPDRFWQVVEKHKATTLYTAPTAIRALMGQGDAWPGKHPMGSLRVIGTVGEPINPAAWLWYYENVGKGRVPLVDTWWQTETGGHMITPLPGATPLKPASAGRPYFGVQTVVLRDDGSEADVGESGHLCITAPWPGMLRGTWGDLDGKRFKEVYFSMFKGLYYTGDGCAIDADGDHWLKGRIDDVLNVSGHRIGTAEVESALVSYPAVAEAAVVGYPHDIKGTGIYTYVTLKEGVEPSDELKKELVAHVRKVLGPIATPDKMQFAPGLPKTRSGKIMRRILRKIAEGEFNALGDTSTLADPAVVEDLKTHRQ
ncbi:MAG TPA: acetate--CoA ligase [Thermoleophilia bacterium]|nr:acetate--CoA ligase [Thermoleophilia bacterium]